MSQPELVLFDSDGWRDFREVRLASLADAPRERRMRYVVRGG